MKRLKVIMSTVLLNIVITTNASVKAKTAGAITISEFEAFNDKTLVAQGAGVRSQFFIDLYVASFFIEENISSKEAKSTDSLQVLNSKSLSAIRLNIVSSLISSDKMLDSIKQGFEQATDGNSKGISLHIAKFISIFNQPIEKKDQFTFISEPDAGVHVLKNNQRLITINSDAFRPALFSIWLGDNPVDIGLKAEMPGE